jgi:hypothetical protein
MSEEPTLAELKSNSPKLIDDPRRVLGTSGKKVRIRYDSKGHNITRELFGYQPWTEKKSGKTYTHKGVHGILEGTPARKCGNACVIVPSELEETVKTSIEKRGGEIKSVAPIVMTPEESKEMVKSHYIPYFKTLEGLLTQASTVNRIADFEECLKRSLDITKKFRSHLKEELEYTEEDQQTIETVNKIFSGIQSISKEDLETAKLEAQFVAKDIEKENSKLTK